MDNNWRWAGSGDGEAVIAVETNKLLCSLDLLPCGCIAKTEANVTALEAVTDTCCSLNTNCGTYDTCCTNKNCNTFTLDIQGRLIVLSPNYDKDYIIIKYLTAVNSAGDYQIPSLALECVLTGLKYYYEANNPKAPPYTRGEGSMLHKMYTAEMNKLKKRLRPLPYEAINNAMGVTPYKPSYDTNKLNRYPYNY